MPGRLRILARRPRSACERQPTLLVSRRIGLLVLGRQLGQLVALCGHAHRPGPLRKIYLIAIPAQLPGDADPHEAAVVSGPDGDPGIAQRPRDPGNRARMVAGIEQLDRTRRLHLAVRRNRVDAVVGIEAVRARQGLLDRLIARLCLDGLGRLAAAPVAAVAREQAAAQRPALGAIAAAAGHLERGALADPALMGRPRSTQLAYLAARFAGQIGLGMLTAQKGATAYVTGDRVVRCADVLTGHGSAAEGTSAPAGLHAAPVQRPVRGVGRRAGYARTASPSACASSTTFWARWPGTSS